MKNRTLSIAAMLAVATAIAGLSGCASQLAGIGGESSFKCKAPEGVACQSVSGTYANANNGPSQHSPTGMHGNMDEGKTPSSVEPTTQGAMVPTGYSRLPSAPGAAALPLGAIRSDPTVIRIWVAPWEDTDGDLMGETYVHLAVDSGRWLIEHNQQRIKQEFAPVKAPAVALITGAPTAMAKPSANAADGAGEQTDAEALSAGIAQLQNRSGDKPGGGNQ